MSLTLVKIIREAIKASGKSAYELARLASVDKSVLSRFLRGERTMTLETADKILTALRCTVTISEAGKKEPPKKRKAESA